MANQYKFDFIDQQIISRLKKDGRQPYASIAAELGLSPSTVQQRVNRLLDSGLISIVAMVHPADFDVQIAMVAIKADGTRLQQIAHEISLLPEVRWVVVCAGQYDILTEIVAEDARHLLSILSEKIAVVQGIRETVTFPYLEIAKRAHEWDPPDLSYTDSDHE